MRIGGQRTVQDEGRAVQKPGDGNELDVGKEQRGQCVRVFGREGKGEMLKLRLARCTRGLAARAVRLEFS